jgi:hypothetical protein
VWCDYSTTPVSSAHPIKSMIVTTSISYSLPDYYYSDTMCKNCRDQCVVANTGHN